MSQLFAWGGQSTRVSALASFLPKKSQGWSPSEWIGWISFPWIKPVPPASLALASRFFTTEPSGRLKNPLALIFLLICDYSKIDLIFNVWPSRLNWLFYSTVKAKLFFFLTLKDLFINVYGNMSVLAIEGVFFCVYLRTELIKSTLGNFVYAFKHTGSCGSLFWTI